MYLGIDSGSVSLKYAVINQDEVVASGYWRTRGEVIKTLQKITEELKDFNFSGIGVTGSGRQFIGALIKADLIVDEITAHRLAVKKFYPAVKTIFEIGGQDSKLIYYTATGVNFEMNSACAAGTGSFLDQQAARLGLSIEEFYQKGLNTANRYKIASKCTVFAESDMINAQQSGVPLGDIIRGTHAGLVSNYFSQLCHGKKFYPEFLLEGGVSENPLLLEELGEKLKAEGLIKTSAELIIPKPYQKIMGAIGAALLCATKQQSPRPLKNISNLEFLGEESCRACPNQCRANIKKYKADGQIVIVGKSCQI